MEIKRDLTPVNYTPGGMREVRGLTMHSMWGYFEGSRAWFKNSDAHASAHYLISAEGDILQMVREKDMAWHAGEYDSIPNFLKPNPNFYTIGIELEDKKDANWPYPEAQRKATSYLVKLLLKRYNLSEDRILLHKNLNPSRRSDPVGQFAIDWVLSGEYEAKESNDWIRSLNIFRDHRFNRIQGPEGNWEAYANAMVGNDIDGEVFRLDLKNAQEEIETLKRQRKRIIEEREEEREMHKNVQNRLNESVKQIELLQETIEELEKGGDDMKEKPKSPLKSKTIVASLAALFVVVGTLLGEQRMPEIEEMAAIIGLLGAIWGRITANQLVINPLRKWANASPKPSRSYSSTRVI